MDEPATSDDPTPRDLVEAAQQVGAGYATLLAAESRARRRAEAALPPDGTRPPGATAAPPAAPPAPAAAPPAVAPQPAPPAGGGRSPDVLLQGLRSELDELRGQVTVAQRELDERRRETERLIAERERLAAERERLAAERARLAEENDELRDRTRGRDQRLERLERELAAAREHVGRVVQEASALAELVAERAASAQRTLRQRDEAHRLEQERLAAERAAHEEAARRAAAERDAIAAMGRKAVRFAGDAARDVATAATEREARLRAEVERERAAAAELGQQAQALVGEVQRIIDELSTTTRAVHRQGEQGEQALQATRSAVAEFMRLAAAASHADGAIRAVADAGTPEGATPDGATPAEDGQAPPTDAAAAPAPHPQAEPAPAAPPAEAAPDPLLDRLAGIERQRASLTGEIDRLRS